MFLKSPLNYENAFPMFHEIKSISAPPPIRFITVGMLFILTISPQFISAEKKIPLLDS